MYASLLVGHAKKCPYMDNGMPPMWAGGSTLSLQVWPAPSAAYLHLLDHGHAMLVLLRGQVLFFLPWRFRLWFSFSNSHHMAANSVALFPGRQC